MLRVRVRRALDVALEIALPAMSLPVVLLFLPVTAFAADGQIERADPFGDHIFGCEDQRPDNADAAVLFGNIRSHGGQARTAAKTHQERNFGIVQMLSEGDFIEIEFTRERIEIAAAEPGT